LTKYELHDYVHYWNDAALRSYGLEYVGGPEWDYETDDGKYVGVVRCSNHERDSSGDWVDIYKRIGV
jgi:hypothetical protein